MGWRGSAKALKRQKTPIPVPLPTPLFFSYPLNLPNLDLLLRVFGALVPHGGGGGCDGGAAGRGRGERAKPDGRCEKKRLCEGKKVACQSPCAVGCAVRRVVQPQQVARGGGGSDGLGGPGRQPFFLIDGGVQKKNCAPRSRPPQDSTHAQKRQHCPHAPGLRVWARRATADEKKSEFFVSTRKKVERFSLLVANSVTAVARARLVASNNGPPRTTKGSAQPNTVCACAALPHKWAPRRPSPRRPTHARPRRPPRPPRRRRPAPVTMAWTSWVRLRRPPRARRAATTTSTRTTRTRSRARSTACSWQVRERERRQEREREKRHKDGRGKGMDH